MLFLLFSMRPIVNEDNVEGFLNAEEVMKQFRFCTVFTKHDKKYYRVVNVTKEPVNNLRLRGKKMVDFYLEHFGIKLKYPHLQCFECSDGAEVPIELCYDRLDGCGCGAVQFERGNTHFEGDSGYEKIKKKLEESGTYGN